MGFIFLFHFNGLPDAMGTLDFWGSAGVSDDWNWDGVEDGMRDDWKWDCCLNNGEVVSFKDGVKDGSLNNDVEDGMEDGALNNGVEDSEPIRENVLMTKRHVNIIHRFTLNQ